MARAVSMFGEGRYMAAIDGHNICRRNHMPGGPAIEASMNCLRFNDDFLSVVVNFLKDDLQTQNPYDTGVIVC